MVFNLSRFRYFFLSFITLLLIGGSSFAQDKPPSSDKEKPKVEEPEANTNANTEALQKATQNPVASLISVPIQNNNNFGINPGYRNRMF